MSTHPLMFSPREILFTCPLSPPWNTSFSIELFPLYAPALTLLFLAKVQLSLLFLDFFIWTDDSIPSHYGKGG